MYTVGQRYLSQLDPQLGLGIIVETEARRVTVAFPAVDEERTYATANAPLSRLLFRVGDNIRLADNQLYKVTRVTESAGVAVYTVGTAEGEEIDVSEVALAAELELNQPQQRLLTGQIDSATLFETRFKAVQHLHELDQTEVRGLLAPRTLLLPHQVYLAQQVGTRHAPRVMLADEVGLGKTIEAGMIIHQQLHTQRAKRVLVLTPEPLMAQWLVELRRKFNLRFDLLNQERLNTDDNPFEEAQWVISCLDLVAQRELLSEQMLSEGWDLVVIDEAHQLEHAEPTIKQCLNLLCARSRGLLLLTATPEQLGQKAHFERLQLLDPHRFASFNDYQANEAHYQRIDQLIQSIESGSSADLPFPVHGKTTSEQVRYLLDFYGTGRCLYRNTRASVAGLPARALHPHPLDSATTESFDHDLMQQLYPERYETDDSWVASHPKVRWLVQFLKANKSEKVLVICGNAKVATALEDYLQMRAGIRSAAFYEGLSLIERDRAAAYFQEVEQGAQVLVCSEIGSEGRNFQFSQHLVLFDLPLSPDLLEQRIGRLDRIGQKNTIHIHVPYIVKSAQERLFKWYAQGLEVFTEHCAGAQRLYEQFAAELRDYCLDQNDSTDFVARASAATSTLKASLDAGRNRLLERHSLDSERAQEYIKQIKAWDNSATLREWLELACNALDLDIEPLDQNTWIFKANEHTHEALVPYFQDDALTGTFDREIAASREDWEFLSWEHPLITETLELFESDTIGSGTVSRLRLTNLPEGTLLLEVIAVVRVLGQSRLDLKRFLPRTPIRLLIDAKGRNLAAALPPEKLHPRLENLPVKAAGSAIKQVREPLLELISTAEKQAQTLANEFISKAQIAFTQHLDAEIERTTLLSQAQADAQLTEELALLKQERDAGYAAFAQSQVSIHGLRLIATHH
jgi:ATP-dependent helicase HepA